VVRNFTVWPVQFDKLVCLDVRVVLKDMQQHMPKFLMEHSRLMMITNIEKNSEKLIFSVPCSLHFSTTRSLSPVCSAVTCISFEGP